MRTDDADTIAGFLASRPDAVARLEDWIGAAAAAFRRRLGEEWDDLLQDARIEITRLLGSGTFRGDAALKTYVWRVVQHACLRRLRAQLRAPVLGEDLDARSGREPSALDEVLRRESAQLLLRIVAAMPEECRQLWRMVAAGLSYKEMSGRTGVEPGALRVRVLRCRRRAAALRAEVAGGAGVSSVTPGPRVTP